VKVDGLLVSHHRLKKHTSLPAADLAIPVFNTLALHLSQSLGQFFNVSGLCHFQL
jgi:hypothetical protein